MKYSGDFHHDLQVSELFEAKLSDILSNKKIEVKRDFHSRRTGNIFIEYNSKGYKSGISTTDADYYCIFISDSVFVMVPTEELKALCRKYIGTKRDIKGGDNDTSKGILLPLNDLIKKKHKDAKYSRGA